MQDWLQLCLDSGCGGSLHATQCRNVSEEATRPYTLEYVTGDGRPWVGGELRAPNLSQECFCNVQFPIRNLPEFLGPVRKSSRQICWCLRDFHDS